MKSLRSLLGMVSLSACLFLNYAAVAQVAAPTAPAGSSAAAVRAGRAPASLVSPDTAADGRVTFRVYAPQASAVKVAGDINQGLNHESTTTASTASSSGINMAKGADGVWSGTSALPMKPGAWRYHFVVDGMSVVDSRNVNTSPYQRQMESLLIVPGDFSETRDVPTIVHWPACPWAAYRR